MTAPSRYLYKVVWANLLLEHNFDINKIQIQMPWPPAWSDHGSELRAPSAPVIADCLGLITDFLPLSNHYQVNSRPYPGADSWNRQE